MEEQQQQLEQHTSPEFTIFMAQLIAQVGGNSVVPILSREAKYSDDAWVRAAGILLEHVHLADNDGETDRHWAPGVGQIEWRSFFREIAQLEQSPRLILEVSPANQRLAYAWLSERGLVR